MENPRSLPTVTGAGRTFAIGTWEYDPSSARYQVTLRFDQYVNGVYAGFQTVDREITLDNAGNTGSGPVLSIRYDTAGATTLELCGSATSTRL